MNYKSWPKRLERGEQSLLHLDPKGRMWCLSFRRHNKPESLNFYNLNCNGGLIWSEMPVPHNGICQDFVVVWDNIVLAMNFPVTFYFFNKNMNTSMAVWDPDVTDDNAKHCLPSIGNYGINPLLFVRNFINGQITVGMSSIKAPANTKWDILRDEKEEPWVVKPGEELIPISHAPGKVGAVAHVTSKGTAFFSLEPYNITHQYTKYMVDNPMFYNMERSKHRDLKGHPFRRIDFSGWNALFNLPQESYLMKLDAEGIAKTIDNWIAVEIDGVQVPLGTEFTIPRNMTGDIKLTALETLTDIMIRCEQPILLYQKPDYPKSVIQIKKLFKGESIVLGRVAPNYDTYTTSSSKQDFFHITITAEVCKTDLDYKVPCCCRAKFCPLDACLQS